MSSSNMIQTSPTPTKGRRKTKSSVLSDEQKKVCLTNHLETHIPMAILTSLQQAHHIASEQKRRENIRAEFDKLVSLTPSLTELENRSELNILTKSADYIDELKQENAKLVELCRMKGIHVPPGLIYQGPKNDGSDIGQ